jgi:GNAT superfamily N-acetyltransferase
MTPTSRPAIEDDIPELLRMYRILEAEQADLRPLWPIADGLDAPLAESFASVIRDEDSLVVIGEIDQVPLGFCWGRSEPLLAQAGGSRVAVIRIIFTEPEARGVGVGEVMILPVLDEMRRRGHHLFDARVSPGHRHAKNFFESNGFSARLIIMHHNDDR